MADGPYLKLLMLAQDCFVQLRDLEPEDMQVVMKTLQTMLDADRTIKAAREHAEKFPNLAARKSEGGVQ